MANQCCVCGGRIALLDNYKNLKKTNELVCQRCDGLLLDYNDRMWQAREKEEIDRIRDEAASFIRTQSPESLNREKLLQYFEEKYASRLDYLGKAEYTQLPSSPADPDLYEELSKKMILSTASVLEGYRVTRQLGVVFGETVFKPSYGHQLASQVGDMFRSLAISAKEMSGQVSIIEEARRFAYTKMMKQAFDRGANAVIAIDSDNTFGDSICYLSLYGTAVYAEPETDPSKS